MYQKLKTKDYRVRPKLHAKENKLTTSTGFTPTPQHGVMSRSFLRIKQAYTHLVSFIRVVHTPGRHKKATPCLVSGFTPTLQRAVISARGYIQTFFHMFSKITHRMTVEKQRNRSATARLVSGFTLIETLVAISILLVSIAGPFTIAIKSLSSAVFARDQITAFYLAQEAVEYVRNVRDSNVLAGKDWLSGLSFCLNGRTCTIDAPNNAIEECGGGQCAALKYNASTGFYNYENGEDSMFTRTVALTAINENETAVSVTISWRTGLLSRTFNMRENILDWQQGSGGSPSPSPPPPPPPPPPSPSSFTHTGANQSYIVPANVFKINIKMWAGGGGGGNTASGYVGGGGGYAEGNLTVNPGDNITIIVGGGGTAGTGNQDGGGGGGGRSAVYNANGDTAIVAGGGGGAGNNAGDGGGGGGTAGENGTGQVAGGEGKGGNQTAGGAAGTGGDNTAGAGSLNEGGIGGGGDRSVGGTGGFGGGDDGGGQTGIKNGGGGGGGGYYGGGGGDAGGGEFNGHGAGGGSGFIGGVIDGSMSNASGITPGNNNDPDRSGFGDGGAANSNGDNGLVLIIPAE